MKFEPFKNVNPFLCILVTIIALVIGAAFWQHSLGLTYEGVEAHGKSAEELEASWFKSHPGVTQVSFARYYNRDQLTLLITYKAAN